MVYVWAFLDNENLPDNSSKVNTVNKFILFSWTTAKTEIYQIFQVKLVLLINSYCLAEPQPKQK